MYSAGVGSGHVSSELTILLGAIPLGKLKSQRSPPPKTLDGGKWEEGKGEKEPPVAKFWLRH